MAKYFTTSLFLLGGLLISLVSMSLFTGNTRSYFFQDAYQCIPCGSDCDKDIHNKPGKCSHCQMDLVKKSTINFKTIQPGELCKYLETHPDAILLDVRTKEEFEGKSKPVYGTVKNAINIPIQVLENQLSELSSYKNKEIIVYCSHSRRSPRASYLLTQNGFSSITNLAGGMSAMKDQSCFQQGNGKR